MSIKAVRDGETRIFSDSIWQAMRPDKYGWKRAADTPKEVAASMASSETEKAKAVKPANAEEYAEKISAARKAVDDAETAYLEATAKGNAAAIKKAEEKLSTKKAALKSLLEAK